MILFNANRPCRVQLAPITLCCVIVSILSLGMSHMFANLVGKPAAVFTFPFHIVTWMWLLGSQRYVYFPNALNPPAVIDPTNIDDRHNVGYDSAKTWLAIIISIGQIVFFGKPACGMYPGALSPQPTQPAVDDAYM